MGGRSRIAAVLLACGCLAQPISAQVGPGAAAPPDSIVAPFPHAVPEEVGLSSEALADLADLVRGWTRDTLIAGAEILVVKDGRAVLHEAMGWSDLEAGEPMQKNSIFRLLALTKPFTGTAALMLAEEGRLELDAPVSRWLPSWANERSGEVTVRQLLTHTAGWEQYGTPRPLASYPSLRAMVDDAGEHGPQHPPGQAYRYSDVNSYALGALVAEVSGMPVERFIEERILGPLDLEDTHTRFAPDTAWAHRVHSRYRLEEGAWTKVWSPDQPQADPFFRASGGLFSTAMDYARWLEAWTGWIRPEPDAVEVGAAPGEDASQPGATTLDATSPEWPRLLSRRTARAAVTPADGPYAFHWEILGDDPLVFGHGGVDGTHAMAIPSRDVIVVYLTQSEGRELRGEWTRAALDAVAPGLDVRRPLASVPAERSGLDVVELTPTQRARYASRYRAGSFTVRIFEEGGRLQRRLPTAGAPVVSLVPLGDHTFAMGRYEGDELSKIVLPLQRLRFVVEDGRATALELMHDGEVRAVLQRLTPAADTVRVAPPTGETEADTVHVAPPTGETEADRASVQAAFDAVQPGGTVLFSPGTYLLGTGAKLTVPDVTVLGHPDGTVLRGCDPEAFMADASEEVQIAFGCTGLYIQAERQTIRGLTFEYTWHGIVVGPYPTTVEEATALRESGEPPPAYPAGGQRIEGNTFRATPNGLRVLGTGNERSVVRDNDFIDVFHAIGIYGAPLHFVDNRVTVAEPERVPFSRHPGSAIIVSPGHTDCAGHVVAGNRIEGYPDPIYVLVRRGETCRGVEIRDNAIQAARVKIPEAWLGETPTAEDSTMVGTPITLMNRTEPTPGPPEADREGILEDILVEGNHIAGAEGLGILVQDVSRSRIAGNTIVGIQRRDPFPGITWDGFDPRWEGANGSAIWLSPGSDSNEIVGNTFQDVAAAAVFLEGDDNRVELQDASDAVRDLGTGNQVSVARHDALRGEWVAVDGEMYGAPVPEASLPLLRFTFDDAQGRWTLPGHPQTFRYTVHGEAAPDSLDLHLPIEAPRTWLIPVRSGLRGDTLDVAFPLAEPYDSARGDPPQRPESSAPGRTGPYLRLSLVRRSAAASETSGLTEEEKDAAGRVDADDIERRTRALVAPEMEGRESGEPGGERAARAIAGWFREAGLEPLGEDGFLQRVPLTLGRAASSSTLTVGDSTFHVGDDFAIGSLPMRTRPAMRFDATGEVVLFGPSLGSGRVDAPLPELDVEGKIVAWVASAGPGDGSPADLMRTYEALHLNGAEAVIALFPGPVPEAWLRSPVFSEVGALDADLYGAGPARPLVLLGREAFGALFGDGSEVRAFMSGFAPGEHRVRPTGREVTLSYEIEETTAAPTRNVVGVLRGSDPELRDEAIVYTAHYDAFGTYDGELYPGAADNALGVAEMIEIADALRASGVRPRRSLVFLAVGAEERGMLGSLYWTRHPTWALDRVVANINMDGGDAEAWGPLHGVIDLTRQATLDDAAAEIGAAMGVPVLPDNTSGGSSGSSDFYDFLRAGVPAIQLMGIGGDPALSRMRMQRFGGQRVHQPGDTIDEGWNWAGPREMAQLYLLLGLRVANADEPPRIRASAPPVPSGPDAAVASIAAPDIAREIGVLADDSMAGRDTPSPELEAAAAYLADRFRSMGLEPAGDDGAYVHRYEYGRVRLLPDETRVGVRGQDTESRVRFDYFLAPADRPVQGEAVYAGVAGRTEALQDAGGKVLLFDLPGAEPDAGWNNRATSALQLANASGAAGVVLVLDPAFPRYRINELATGMAQQRVPIPLVGMTESAAGALAADAGAELDALRAAGPPAPLGHAVLEIRTRAAEDRPTPPNVAAMLPGSDPELMHTYVVLTAHVDHVGVGAPNASGDSIFNGADDNASGTAALLEIAEAFAALDEPPSRSVVFLAASGEEKGILGTRAYLEDPPLIDVEGVVANVNLDLIGRGPPDTVVATGQEHSSLQHVLRRVVADHPDLGLSVALDSGQAGRPLLLASDQIAFVEKGIPAVFLSGGAYGVHHTPADEAPLVDHDKAARTAGLAFLLAHAIASGPEEPAWTEEGWAEVQRMVGQQ